ncbi:MAG TPA: WecB/TagA/CpsF family glycosyltransferase [bacterium]|nr:WecB/TagA/CpsF family glycosyltransferase [bacterium]
MSRIDILGVGFDPMDLDGAAARIVEFALQPDPRLVVTANVEMVMLTRRDPEVREILRRASLVVADGVGVVWGARQLGRPLPGRVPGIDLAARLCQEAARRRWRVYLLGGRPGVAAGAAARLRAWYPGFQVVGAHDGYFSLDTDRDVVRAIREASPTLLLAGLGAPRQERWLSQRLEELHVPVVMGIGGTLDVWTGRARRAPRVWQTLGLEWCYRLLREPRRFGRQLAIPHFMAVVYGKRLRALLRPASRS